MSGTTLAAGVPHDWQLSLGPRPLGLSSCTFNTRALSMLWTVLQPSHLGWRHCRRHLLCHQKLFTTFTRSSTTSTSTHTKGTHTHAWCKTDPSNVNGTKGLPSGLQCPMQPHRLMLCLSLNCPLNMSKSSRSFGLENFFSYSAGGTGTCTEITVPVERAHYKKSMDVSVGWVLMVLCMQCCNYQVVRFCGAIPPPMGGGASFMTAPAPVGGPA